MSDLTEFLLARYAAEEALARKASDVDWAAAAPSVDDFAFACEWSPARVLAECEAKRRIVRDLYPALGKDNDSLSYEFGATEADPEDLLRLLALPYADHPDYREEWRP